MTTTADVPELTSFVGGGWMRGPTGAVDTNPAWPTEVVATTSLADASVAAAAVEAAAKALASWRVTPTPARGEVLRRAADLLDARAAEIGRALTREEGKTLPESTRETQLAAKVLRYFAGQALDPEGETYPSHQPDVLLYTTREPRGVVTAITPWNFPIAIPAWKLAPALVLGNTVAWKPADLVPLTAIHLLQAFIDAGLPEGVLNVVLGRGSEIGDVLTTHPEVAAVTFTGSNAVGRAIQGRAAAAGKTVQMELGGKNPAIVLADADLDQAAKEISTAAFGATGQKCTATSRVIVERSVMSEMAERLQAHAEAWRLGDPLDAATTMGPLASADQLRTVTGHVEEARRQGARPAGAAGSAPLDGYFVAPTVLVDVEPTFTVAREEVFGPVVALLPVDSCDEAFALANDTPYGLSASLFTGDLTAALRFTRESRSGIIKVNQGSSGMEHHVPFGGTKESSYGPREQGKAAREFFTESKTVYLGLPSQPPV